MVINKVFFVTSDSVRQMSRQKYFILPGPIFTILSSFHLPLSNLLMGEGSPLMVPEIARLSLIKHYPTCLQGTPLQISYAE